MDKAKKRTKKKEKVKLTDLLASNNILTMCRGMRNPASAPEAGTAVYISKCSELGVVPNSKVVEDMDKVRRHMV